MLNIHYKPRGFGNSEAWYRGKLQAYISSTFGAQVNNGKYRVQLLSTGGEAFVNTVPLAKELITTHVADRYHSED